QHTHVWMMGEQLLNSSILDQFINSHEQSYEEFLNTFTHLLKDLGTNSVAQLHITHNSLYHSFALKVMSLCYYSSTVFFTHSMWHAPVIGTQKSVLSLSFRQN
uniref:Uncharacterized protein n=1 Tax=Strigops habroptila TaxID=2489341 RepID=A0A672UXW1_STRHB